MGLTKLLWNVLVHVGISRGLLPVLSKKCMPNSGCDIHKMNIHSKNGHGGYEEHCAAQATYIIFSEFKRMLCQSVNA